MPAATAARGMDDAGDLFARVGAFLAAQRLGPEPENYAFAYAALSGTDPALTAAVERLTDGGFRLTGADLARLGVSIVSNGRDAEPVRTPPPPIDRTAATLAAETQARVDDFTGIVRAMRQETEGFGRDLAARVALLDSATATGIGAVAGAMIRRAYESEERLACVTAEAEALRAKLAVATSDARRDPLTGLANRLALDETLAALSAADAPHCLAFCDIDRFKAINDRHGHHVGDRVLRAIGEALAEVREDWLVARYGGEEFAVLMPCTALADAAALIDEARAAISARRFRNRDTDEPIGSVTFSAGVVALRADETAEQAFRRADRLLYAAKSGGRDRISAG